MGKLLTVVTAFGLCSSAALGCIIPRIVPLTEPRLAELEGKLAEAGFGIHQLVSSGVLEPNDGPGFANAERDAGLASDGAYQIEILHCGYRGIEPWKCQARIERYVRNGRRLVNVEDDVSSGLALEILAKIRGQIGMKGEQPIYPDAEPDVLTDEMVERIDRIAILKGTILAVFDAVCPTSLVFLGECATVDDCNLKFQRFERGS